MANNDNSILVTKYIRKFIVENEEVRKLINTNNVFPLIANADTTFPFVVYGRTSLVPIYTKDNEITIDVIKLESITEETSDDAYIQKMSFTFTCR